MKKPKRASKKVNFGQFKAGNEELSVGSTILGERGQVVIPKDIRDRLKLRPGAQLMVLHQKHGPVMLLPIEHMRQFLEGMTKNMSQFLEK